MFKLFHQIEANLTDARVIGPAFVARHLRPWAERHSFPYAGKPFTFRRANCDSQTIRYLLVGGEYGLEPEARTKVRERHDRIVAAGKTPVIIDAGGNIGMTAVWFANTYPKATIVSIEPDPENFALLSENVSNWPNVIPIKAALGGQPGHVNMTGDVAWAVQTQRADKGDTEIVTIRQAQERAGPDTELLIVKIDIEGFEDDVFAGDTEWLDETACLMIEPHDWLRPRDRTSLAFQREVGTRGFNVYVCTNNLIYVRH